jgi:hypothetical protein
MAVEIVTMRVRLKFGAAERRGDTRFVEMAKLPRVGEQLVSGTFGTCEVVQVLRTPDSDDGDATVILRKENVPDRRQH